MGRPVLGRELRSTGLIIHVSNSLRSKRKAIR
jgi:hypothetical protein